jgi:hypothetical protein
LSNSAQAALPGETNRDAPRIDRTDKAAQSEILIAKRGGGLGRLLGFGGGKSKGRIRGSITVEDASNPEAKNPFMAMLKSRVFWTNALVIVFYGLLLIAAWKLLRSLYRGLFVRSYPGVVMDAHMTAGGMFHPIVAFEDKRGQAHRMMASLQTATNPRGARAWVEVTGRRAKVVLKPGSFGRAMLSVFTPILLAAATLILAYLVDTGQI